MLFAPVIYSQSHRYSLNEWQSEILKSHDPLNVNFITFNYTSTLERLLGSMPLNCANDEISMSWGSPVGFNAPIHVHGKLDDVASSLEKLIFGVSYRDQIEHPSLDLGAWVERRLLKPDRLDFENRSTLDALSEVSSILRTSDLIVLFGVSLGASDVKWWNGLGELMRKNGRLHLVYSDFNLIAQCPVAGFERLLQEHVRDKVLRAMEVGLETRKNIGNRILVMSQGPTYYPDDTERRNPIIGDPFCLTWFGRQLGIGD